jgi:hypothetical protein
MLSLFRQTSRQKGLKKRRGKRGRRVAQLVVPAILTTALLIPVVTTITDGSGSCETASSSTESATSTDAGGSSSSSSTCVAGTGSGGTTDGSGGTGGSESAGTGETSGASGAGASVSGAGSSGSLEGVLLTFTEDPPTTSDSTTPGDSGSSTTEVTTETGSAFDDYPWADLTCIEEEWELVVSEPDALLAAPQLGTVMTPFEDSNDFYLAFAINHRLDPTFSAGGLEVQLWYQGQLLGWQAVEGGVLSSTNETVRWTQRLEIKGGKLRFSIVQGDSTTWGKFGQGESMHLELDTTLADLNDYHPNVSIESSGVLFASNRVGSLVLKKVRGFAADGTQVSVDSDPIVVFGPPEK